MSRTRRVLPLVLVVVLAGLSLAACSGTDGYRRAEPVSSPSGTVTEESALVTQGQQLAFQLNCIACHTIDGARAAGPTWRGLAGSEVTLRDGSVVIADSEYLRESIINADLKIRDGYGPSVMSSSIQGQLPKIREGNNLDALVAYIESLR